MDHMKTNPHLIEFVCLNRELINYLKEEPPVYHESSKAFGDDEHISKSMLDAHLNTENDGASRRLSTIQNSVEWIVSYCKNGQGKQLLDLGCGPGIYSELLYDKGFSVTGIDFSKRSIEYAQNHAKETCRKIRYYYQNYLEMDYENEFDVIILIYCDFGVLPPQDRSALLKKIQKALKKDGILILDAFNRPYLDSFQPIQSIRYENGGFWSAEPYVIIQRNKYFEETANTLEQYLILTDDNCECFNIWNQIYSKETFIDELRSVGFSEIGVFDDVTGADFTGKSETICGIFKAV